MNNLNTYIVEKLKKINSKNIGKQYNYFPQTYEELHELIEKLIKERGDEADLNDIDTSKITDMSNLFSSTNFNGNISNWDVSNVKDMTCMFDSSKFDGDISNWNVKNVKHCQFMFYNCPLANNKEKQPNF